MTKLKVLTILGTRPEIIRLSRLIPLFDEWTNHVVAFTGQNSARELRADFFCELDLRTPDVDLGISNSSPGAAMGQVLIRSEELIAREKPDAILILGDTNSAVAALIGERLGTPVYHMEAGNRSWDSNVPEELNRRMVDHVSTFNLAYTEHARRNLLVEGLHPRFIQVTGSPLPEVYAHHNKAIEASTILTRMRLEAQDYLLASFHRQENVDHEGRLIGLLEALGFAASQLNKKVVVSLHPRTHRRIEDFRLEVPPELELHKPFGFFEWSKLQRNALCVISDSGSVPEESASQGFVAVSLRDSIERPESLEVGGVQLSGISKEGLLQACGFAIGNRDASIPAEYKVMDFSRRVLSFVLSTAPLSHEWRNYRG